MQRCHFCKRRFNSRQSVRAHLGWCFAYKNRDRIEALEEYYDRPQPQPQPEPAYYRHAMCKRVVMQESVKRVGAWVFIGPSCLPCRRGPIPRDQGNAQPGEVDYEEWVSIDWAEYHRATVEAVVSKMLDEKIRDAKLLAG